MTTHLKDSGRLQGDPEFAYMAIGEKKNGLFSLFINKATAAYSTPLDSLVSGTGL